MSGDRIPVEVILDAARRRVRPEGRAMSGDLRAVLAEQCPDWLYTDDEVSGILAALAAADEPLVAEVRRVRVTDGTGTVTVFAMTEDVLRERLRDAFHMSGTAKVFLNLRPVEIDAIVRALLGGDS